MTWFDNLPDGATDWDRLASLCPEAFDAMAQLVAAAWEDTDPAVLELARLRIATLLGSPLETAAGNGRAGAAGLTEEKAAAVAMWPTSPLFSASERACLALTEQFVIDANQVTEAQVADVSVHLGGQGCYAFVAAVSVLETFYRACLTLGIATIPAIDVFSRAAEPKQTRKVSL